MNGLLVCPICAKTAPYDPDGPTIPDRSCTHNGTIYVWHQYVPQHELSKIEAIKLRLVEIINSTVIRQFAEMGSKDYSLNEFKILCIKAIELLSEQAKKIEDLLKGITAWQQDEWYHRCVGRDGAIRPWGTLLCSQCMPYMDGYNESNFKAIEEIKRLEKELEDLHNKLGKPIG